MATTVEILQYVVAPIIGVIGITIPAVMKLWTVRAESKVKRSAKEAEDKKEQEQEVFRSNMSDTSRVWDLLKESLSLVPYMNRAMIIESHNSGGIPSPSNPNTYLTCLYEDYLPGMAALKDTVQNMPLDKFHRDSVILPLAYDGKTVLDRATNKGYLRDLYEAYGHEWSKVYTLRINQVSMIYLVFSFAQGSLGEMEPVDREKMRVQYGKLRAIFQKY